MFLRKLAKKNESPQDRLNEVFKDALIFKDDMPEGAAIALEREDGKMIYLDERGYPLFNPEQDGETFVGTVTEVKVPDLSDGMKDVRYTMGAIQNALVDMEDTRRCPCERIKRHLNELPTSLQEEVDDVFHVLTDKNEYDILWYRGRYGWKHIVQGSSAPKTDVLLCLRYSYH